MRAKGAESGGKYFVGTQSAGVSRAEGLDWQYFSVVHVPHARRVCNDLSSTIVQRLNAGKRNIP
jgi:hypothetical protein